MKRRANETSWTTAQILSEALPFIQRHTGKTIVVKFGGNAMGSEELTQQFANDIVLLKQCGLRPVVVHGGGPQIGSMLDRLKIKSEFVDGLRVSDMETVGVAEMVLSGAINKSIVAAINKAGGKAVGLSGRDANLIVAEAVNKDLGFTGNPVTVNPGIIHTLTEAEAGFIPVVSPISSSDEGRRFNVNADTAAGVIAGALNAARLMLLTDIEGVMDAEKNLLTDLSLKDARSLINDEIATGGMIPKLNTAINAVEDGVEAVVILDGRRAHGLLVELFTDVGAGTLIR